MAEQAYSSPADDRTDEDNIYLQEAKNSWYTSIGNLAGDITAVDTIFYTLSNPEILFDEPSAPEGTKETDYYIDIPGIGFFNGLELFKSEEREVYDLKYRNEVIAKQVGQAQEGQITVASTEEVATKTTRYGINAFLHDFKSFGKGLQEKITGKNLTDPTIKDNENKDER